MKVVVIDDNESLAEQLKELAEVEGYEVAVFHSLKEAREGLEGVEEPMIIFLDHDFSPIGEIKEHGYDLCEWLRENHPFGLFLPIIYLTGREAMERFVKRQSEKPIMHPTEYISKDQLASDIEIIPNKLKQYHELFERVQELFESQSAKQALIGFRDMQPEEAEIYEVE